jgi:hypothetical protein
MLLKAGVEDSISQGSEFSETMAIAAKPARLNQILHILTSLGQADMKANSSSPLPLELAVLKATTRPVAAAAPATTGAPASSGAAPVSSQPSRQSTYSSTPTERSETAQVAPDRGRTPWEEVVWAMRHTKNRRFVVGPLLRNVEVPESVEGKISLRFKSHALKNNFVEEMQDQRSRDALKTAITAAYGSELSLEIRSPHETDDGGEPGQGNASPTGASQPKTAAQESAMVRAAMAMGARVVAEEDAGNPDESPSETSDIDS